MAMHVWNGSSWVTVNRNTNDALDRGFVVWNGSAWVDAINAKVWDGSGWKGFLDNVTLGGVSAQCSGFGTLTCVFQIGAYGGWYYTQGAPGSLVYGGDWLKNFDNVGQYEVRAVQTYGTAVLGSAVNTWLNLGTTRSWYLQTTYDDTAIIAVSIRHATTGTVLVDSVQVTLDNVSFN